MIVTLTLNPAIDKTVYIDPMVVGGLNRVKKYDIDAGGKGINVSKIVAMLGGTSVATGFYGGSNTEIFKTELSKQKCINRFVEVACNTRTNLKVLDDVNGITEINEPGVIVSDEEERQVIDTLLSMAGADVIFVLAGSMHKNASPDFYQTLCSLLRAKGATVFIDADNEAFSNALKAKPDFIKPNSDELLRYYGKTTATDQELIEMCKKLVESGIQTVVLSMGKDGALFVTQDECYKADALQVEVSSTVGAGDSLVGGFAYAADNKMSLVDSATLAMACSAGAVTTMGTKPPSLDMVIELRKQVVLNKVY